MPKVLLAIALITLLSCGPGEDGSKSFNVAYRTGDELFDQAMDELLQAIIEKYRISLGEIDKPQLCVEMSASRVSLAMHSGDSEYLEAKATGNFGRKNIYCEKYIVADYLMTDTSKNVSVFKNHFSARPGKEDERQYSDMQRWFCSGNPEQGIEALDTMLPAIPPIQLQVLTGPAENDEHGMATLSKNENNLITWAPAGPGDARVVIMLLSVSQLFEGKSKKDNSFIITEDDGEFILEPKHLRMFSSGHLTAVFLARDRLTWMKQSNCVYKLSNPMKNSIFCKVE